MQGIRDIWPIDCGWLQTHSWSDHTTLLGPTTGQARGLPLQETPVPPVLWPDWTEMASSSLGLAAEQKIPFLFFFFNAETKYNEEDKNKEANIIYFNIFPQKKKEEK